MLMTAMMMVVVVVVVDKPRYYSLRLFFEGLTILCLILE